MLDFLDVSTKSSAPLDADTSQVGADKQIKQPAFITTAALGTFAGGSVFITVVWKVLAQIFDSKDLWIPAVLAAILGIYFFWKAMAGEKLKGPDVMGAALVAVVNACILWSSAVGLDVGSDEIGLLDSSAS